MNRRDRVAYDFAVLRVVPHVHRTRYYEYLATRLQSPRAFHEAALEACEALRRTTPRARPARR